jgi:hypothetical protein
VAKKDDGPRVERILVGVAEELIGVLTLRAWQAITSATPVDTGFARSTVFPSVTSTISGSLNRPNDRAAAHAFARKALSNNFERAQNISKTYKLAQGKVFIVALARYFVYLNAGTSAQAGPMFVQRAVEAAVRSLANFKPRSAA